MHRHFTRLWKYWLSKIYSCPRTINFDRGLIDQVIPDKVWSYKRSEIWKPSGLTCVAEVLRSCSPV